MAQDPKDGAGAGGSGGGSSSAGAGGGNGGGGSATDSLTNEMVRRFMKGFRRPEDAIYKLLRDNRVYRRRFRGDKTAEVNGREAFEQEIADLEAEVQRLQGLTLQPGEVAVSAADATALAEYKKLGDIKTLAKLQADHDKLKGELVEKTEAERDATAAEKMGWKPKVLTELRKLRNFVLEERDVEVEGQDGKKETKKMPYARVAGDDKAEWLPLDKYAEKHLSDFLPSLQAESAEGGASTGNRGNAAGTAGQRGVTLPRQNPSTGSAPSNDVVGSTLTNRYQTPSQRAAAKK